MKSRTLNKAFFFGALPFVICALIAVFLQQLNLLLLPVGLLVIYLLFQKPVLLFYGLLICVPWSIEYNFSSSLGTDLPDEPLMVLNALAVVVCLIYNHKTLTRKSWWHPLILLLLLQCAWLAITVFYSTNLLISIKYLLAKSWYLLSFVAGPVVFFTGKKEVKTATFLLLSSMVLLVCIVLIRHYQNGFTFAEINDSLSPFFRNHVNYSALLVCMVPLLIAFYKSAEQIVLKRWMLFFLLIVLMALYLSYARGAWLALVVGLGVYWLLSKDLLVKAFFAFIIFCSMSIFYLKSNDHYLHFAPKFKTTIFHSNFSEHLIATYEGKDVSTAERFYRWVAGINMIKEKPVVGFGPNTFYQNYWGYTVPAFKTWVSNNEDHSTIHNYFLLILIEQGVPGLLFFLFLIGYAFYRLQYIYKTTDDLFWKRTAACIAVLLIMVCTVNFLSDLIETDKIGSIFYTCMGVLICMDQQLKKSKLSTNIEGIA